MKRARSPHVQNQRANTINNTTNNINNYFSAAPKPETTEVATQTAPEPMRLLDSEGKKARQEKVDAKNGKNGKVTLWQLQNSGELRAGCLNKCKNSWVSMERFAPDAEAEHSAGASQRFHDALAAFRAGHRVGDEAVCQAQLAIVLGLRTNKCDSCREKKKLSPAQRACKDEWDRMRQEACRRQNGCANQDCPERGMAAWIALQADHGTNDKVYRLSDYTWWASHGGVEGMRKELKNIHQFICGVCHALEPTSNQGRRETSTTPERKPEETDDQYKKRCFTARIRVPKYNFVDARKAQIGHCQYPGCGRVCTLQNAVGFHWDHRDQSTKRKCRCPVGPDPKKPLPCQDCEDRIFGRNPGGVAGLAGNLRKETALDSIPRGETVTTRELLEAEMVPKCDMLCIPCHLSRKPSGRARDDASV